MERKEFLSKLGIGFAAVCVGCGVAACGSSKSNDPTPDKPDDGDDDGNLFSVNLNSELTAVGQSKVSNGVILVRTAAGNDESSFTAVQVACTHQGTAINYNNAQGRFICPNHGSQFSNAGAVLVGPATTALKQYNIDINGNTLTVSA
ncbi:Rieske 2Fe-2S domain-containing protein [Mucilaginibacter sp. UR6-1]|uniref:QcrA and Rieske domain-containing protein n=1 Tax=Mucilaginibacter sp. UR6-1 TaxID=1435643 RepID=UPI001E348323|nr:Rieske 2Fe-2S domain-containing protein [Mucilaginibacter sp. UR6-1]MCC8407394.1 Rieske 2Fe-2S domain-containing protein [Mucilaginibacter sp. UR6-1]